MYKIKNYLFGWDYIHWSNSADDGVSKIFKNPEGKIYYWRYSNCYYLDTIPGNNRIIWLTCKPEKYGL